MDIAELTKLLQPSEEDQKRAMSMGLLSAGLGVMANARNQGGRLGPALGQGGLLGLHTYQQMTDPRQQAQRLQMAASMSELEEKQKQRAAQQAALQGLPDQYKQAAAMGVPISEIFKQLNPDQQLVTVEGPDGRPMQKWIRKGETTGVDIGPAPQKESAAPWYVKRTPDGKTIIDPAFAEFEKTKASFSAPRPPMQPVAYIDEKGNTVWGTISEAKGKPAANYNPALQGQLAQSKEAGKTTGEEQTKAVFNLPGAISKGEEALRQTDELLKHPGFKQAVGASSMLGIQKIPGTPARDFMNRLDQAKGGAFLTAFETLKGGGQITEVEGKKATEAIARMDNATSEEEFTSAVKDYQAVIRKAVNNAKLRAGNKPQPVGGAKFLGFE